MDASYDGLMPSEVVHLTTPDPAEQAPLVARSVTPPSPSGRGGTTLLRQREPRSCTVFVMTPPNEHTSEGGRDDRGVQYHAEPTLSSAQVLKYFACFLGFASDFAPDQLSDSGKLESCQNGAPNTLWFPWKFRKPKVLGTPSLLFGFPGNMHG